MDGRQLVGEAILDWVVLYASLFAEAVAVVIIAYAVALATWHIIRTTFNQQDDPHPWLTIRLDLARSLGLALEFLLAADILRTAVAPTWEELGKLAAIAIIRTGLNFFLNREMSHEEQRAREDRDRRERSNMPTSERHRQAA